ncbi:MAG: 2-C-methyl-D-erythritol 4-phosphate cytidylyltransferase [Bacteroidales bacterium]|nr:2-C-methyl-D-erythritol 4-phosphate cytidylyltransferase [Candidatus Hennigimonas equi]
MDRKKYCIFACGGHGTRMGSSLPKQFLRLGGKTILQMSIERILEAVPGTGIITVLPEEYVQFWIKESHMAGLDEPQHLVPGGISRFHSVRNALEKVPEDSIVAVHDGVRPFVSVQMVRRLFEEAGTCPAVVPVTPVTDTVKVLDSDMKEIPGAVADRSVLFGAQTPQLFWSETIKAAYRQPFDTSFTDDASVVRKSGVEIRYVPGEKYNVKITTPEDLLLAGALLSSL